MASLEEITRETTGLLVTALCTLQRCIPDAVEEKDGTEATLNTAIQRLFENTQINQNLARDIQRLAEQLETELTGTSEDQPTCG